MAYPLKHVRAMPTPDVTPPLSLVRNCIHAFLTFTTSMWLAPQLHDYVVSRCKVAECSASKALLLRPHVFGLRQVS
ncbi:protein of unknown function [Shewanella benthica]|uniref:Uncharacterized protein n=1 Tax=Shewanella benthica TaxID=43661 RepID=A0A330M984_9GAMM|nr:protein of unknown function [Shewanella benthica]